ncbi:DnaJ domain containing protein [Lactarius tabidus]
MSQSKRDGDAPKEKENPFDRNGFLYSVLNLPDTASSEEVRERYKTLSVLFHPDKQREERTKDTASKRFLEIQKAYEVLSDPFLRTVYDIYGFEGTHMKWPPELRSKPRDELVKVLNRSNWELEAQRMEDLVRSHGRVVIGVNASSLFSNVEHVDSAPSFRGWYGRLQGIRMSSFALRHSFQREIEDKTRLIFTTRAPSGKSGMGSLLGTVKHQYSPRLSFEATASLLRAHFVMMKARYHNEGGTFVLQTYLSPSLGPAFPPITVTHSRRLFKDSLTQGVLICHMGNEPHFSVNIVSPHRFGGSWSGFGTGVRQWSCGINLAGLGTSLRAEWGLVLPELMSQASLAIQLSLAGPGWVVTGSWGDEHAGITTTVGFNAAGVELTLNLSYLGQRLVLPVVLAENGNAPLAYLVTTLPSAAFLLAYQFILKPRRRKQRADFYRQARKELLEEKSNIRREIEETILLLRETARRHTQAEKIKEGLVVLEASYGPTDPDPEARALIVDVTVPIQALVHKSQLYIPGHRSKSGLQGFYDPVPSCAKSLHIRYTFGGRMHYCEIPDYKPVVLPLGDHLVERVA